MQSLLMIWVTIWYVCSLMLVVNGPYLVGVAIALRDVFKIFVHPVPELLSNLFWNSHLLYITSFFLLGEVATNLNLSEAKCVFTNPWLVPVIKGAISSNKNLLNLRQVSICRFCRIFATSAVTEKCLLPRTRVPVPFGTCTCCYVESLLILSCFWTMNFEHPFVLWFCLWSKKADVNLIYVIDEWVDCRLGRMHTVCGLCFITSTYLLHFVQKIVVFGECEGCMPFKVLLEDDGEAFPESVDIKPVEDVAVIPYSSGNVGFSKGVMLTHKNLVANLQQFRY